CTRRRSADRIRRNERIGRARYVRTGAMLRDVAASRGGAADERRRTIRIVDRTCGGNAVTGLRRIAAAERETANESVRSQRTGRRADDVLAVAHLRRIARPARIAADVLLDEAVRRTKHRTAALRERTSVTGVAGH